MQRRRKQIFSPTLTFQVFYKIFSVKKLGLIATYINVGISFIQLIIFVFQAFVSLASSENDFPEFVNYITSYAYMMSLMSISSSIYFAIRTMVFAITGLYFLLFLGMRWTIKNQKPINSIERLFDWVSDYYATVVLLPTTEMCFREFFCDPDVMVPLNQTCGQGKHIAVLFFAVISFVLGVFMSFVNVMYSLNGIYDKKNYLSGENRLYDSLLVVTKVITAIIIAIGASSTAFTVIYLAVNLVLGLVLLLYFMFYYPYNKLATEYYVLFWLSIYVTESLSFMVYVLIGDAALTSGYIFIMLVFCAVPGIFYLYIRLKMRLVNKDHTSDASEFILKVQQLLQLKQNEKINRFEEVQFRGIIARHMEKCVLKKCFCKEAELFDPKKNRYVEMGEWHSNKSLMLKYYVRHLFEESVKEDPLHPDLLISYAEFLFEKFRNTHLALYQIMKIAQSNKFLHPYHRFKIYKLKQKISDYINARNLEALDKTLEIESVIFVEEQLNKVMTGMKEIVTNSLSFWSYLVNKDLDLEKLSQMVQKMHDSVENTDKLWNPLKKYLRKQKKLMYFYNWFLKDFLHKRILLSEEEIDELFDNETFSVYSNDFIHILRDDNIIFQEDSAIIHMSGNYNDLGKIIKTNRTATKLFKYTKEELEKSHVNVLMPKLIADRHNSYLESYIHTGKSQVLYTQRKTFAKDKNGFIIPIWMIVKQLDNPDGMIQYVGLLRPLAQKKDEQSYYMLMNNFGEISGISKNLTEHLKLPGDIFQKNVINAVLLAPKLIKYLYFAKLLHDEREKKINESEEIDQFLFKQETEKKKETKFHHIIRMSDKSPFMASSNKVSALRDFMDLDNLKIDGIIGTNTKIEAGEKSPREDDAMTERNFNQDQENKEIEFTFRLPQKLNRYLKEFQILKAKKHGLLNNQSMLINAVESKDLLKEALKRSDSNGAPKPGKPAFIFKKKAAFHLASYKHAVDSYVEALRTVSNAIARSNNNNVYRIKGVIVTDQYGPENDIIKYIKIVEITKKVEKFSEYQLFNSERTMPMTPKGAERRDSSNLTFFSSQSERIGTLKMKMYTSNMKTIRPSTFKNPKDPEEARLNEDEPYSENDIPKENFNGASGLNENGDELESPTMVQSRRRNSHVSENDKSSKKDEDEEEGKSQSNESERQAIMNELKNNLLAPFQSIYQKEDNLQINNHFRSLNNVKWFIRILFLIVIPINIIQYVTGPLQTFNSLDKAVNNIFENEDLRKDYFRAHDSIITILLDNAGQYDTLKATIPARITALLDLCNWTLADAYNSVTNSNSKNEWTSVLYDYIPKVQSTTSMHYEGPFANMTVAADNALQKLPNALSQIVTYNQSKFTEDDEELVFYRSNSFQKFNTFLTEVTNEIFNSLQDDFNGTEKLSTFILVAEGVMFFLSFFGILRLIILVIRSLKEILRTFTAIENDYLENTQRYYYRLHEYLEAAKSQYINVDMESDLLKRSTRDVNSKFGENPEARFQKKFKNITDKTFMQKDSVRILMYYGVFILLSCGLAIALHLETLASLDTLQTALVDGQTFLRLNPTYLVSLIALKELFYNKTFYTEFDYPYMDDTVQQLNHILNRTLFKSDMSFVTFIDSFMDGTPCDTFKSSLSVQQYEDCKNFALGELASGLISFHNSYKNVIIDTLTMQDFSNFAVTIETVYDYGQLIWIIDSIFMEQALAKWRTNMESFLSSKENLLVILIVAVSVLNVVVFFGAERGVVGSLNEKFLLYRKIFNKYMLGDALVREKKIKSRLVKLRLLNN